MRTFVSLQQELPPQGEVKIGGVAGFLPYKPTAQVGAGEGVRRGCHGAGRGLR